MVEPEQSQHMPAVCSEVMVRMQRLQGVRGSVVQFVEIRQVVEGGDGGQGRRGDTVILFLRGRLKSSKGKWAVAAQGPTPAFRKSAAEGTAKRGLRLENPERLSGGH